MRLASKPLAFEPKPSPQEDPEWFLAMRLVSMNTGDQFTLVCRTYVSLLDSAPVFKRVPTLGELQSIAKVVYAPASATQQKPNSSRQIQEQNVESTKNEKELIKQTFERVRRVLPNIIEFYLLMAREPRHRQIGPALYQIAQLASAGHIDVKYFTRNEYDFVRGGEEKTALTGNRLDDPIFINTTKVMAEAPTPRELELHAIRILIHEYGHLLGPQFDDLHKYLDDVASYYLNVYLQYRPEYHIHYDNREKFPQLTPPKQPPFIRYSPEVIYLGPEQTDFDTQTHLKKGDFFAFLTEVRIPAGETASGPIGRVNAESEGVECRLHADLAQERERSFLNISYVDERVHYFEVIAVVLNSSDRIEWRVRLMHSEETFTFICRDYLYREGLIVSQKPTLEALKEILGFVIRD